MVKSFVFFCMEAAAAEEGRCGAALALCDREQGNWGQERLTRRPPQLWPAPPSLTITCVLTQAGTWVHKRGGDALGQSTRTDPTVCRSNNHLSILLFICNWSTIIRGFFKGPFLKVIQQNQLAKQLKVLFPRQVKQTRNLIFLKSSFWGSWNQTTILAEVSTLISAKEKRKLSPFHQIHTESHLQ